MAEPGKFDSGASETWCLKLAAVLPIIALGNDRQGDWAKRSNNVGRWGAVNDNLTREWAPRAFVVPRRLWSPGDRSEAAVRGPAGLGPDKYFFIRAMRSDVLGLC